MTTQDFDNIIQKRRSVRIYDADALFDETVIKRGLERAVLSPNSSNMQLWEFYWVKSKSMHDTLSHACLGQSAMKTANQAVVFVTRQDKWNERAKWNLANMEKRFEGKELNLRDKRNLNYYRKLMPLVYRYDPFGFNTILRSIIVFFMSLKKPFLKIRTHSDQRVITHKSVALAAQTFMLSLASEGYDTCPMEGFDIDLVKKALNLPHLAEITMIVACGIGKPEGIYLERQRVPNEEVIFEI